MKNSSKKIEIIKIKMEDSLRNTIAENINLLVQVIIQNHPHISKDHFHHKIKQLGLPCIFKPTIKLNDTPIIKTVKKSNLVVVVKKSIFSNFILTADEGDFEDLRDQNLVIDISTKIIVGSEDSEGHVIPLNKQLIEVCDKYKLKYQIPLNLNQSDEPDNFSVITTEIEELGLNLAESEDEENED